MMILDHHDEREEDASPGPISGPLRGGSALDVAPLVAAAPVVAMLPTATRNAVSDRVSSSLSIVSDAITDYMEFVGVLFVLAVITFCINVASSDRVTHMCSTEGGMSSRKMILHQCTLWLQHVPFASTVLAIVNIIILRCA